MNIVFIFGSPRSGTTILANILGCHPDIAEWYEPYYVWENYFRPTENDIWQENQLNSETRRKLRLDFLLFAKRSKKLIVLDKLPTHAFNLKIIHNIFPDAKWIHIVRDGRDVTLSMKKEWAKRRRIVEQKDFLGLLKTAFAMLARQPLWRCRIKALLFELSTIASLNPYKYLNKSRWRGKIGWGPRFENWQEYLSTHSSIEFNAMQWVESVQATRRYWPNLPEENKIEIRYEDLLRSSEETISKVLNTLGAEASPGFFEGIPKLKRDNSAKWKTGLTGEECCRIKPVLESTLCDLGYAHPTE